MNKDIYPDVLATFTNSSEKFKKIMPVSIQIFYPEIQIIRLISVLLLTMPKFRDIIIAFTILKTDDFELR